MARWRLEAEYTEKYQVEVEADSMEGAREIVAENIRNGAEVHLQTDISRDYFLSISKPTRYVKTNTPRMVELVECQWYG